MDRNQKETLKAEFGDLFRKANGAIVAEYRGMTVAELTELRRNLRKVGAEFKVIKNRVAKKAVEADVPSAQAISPKLKGPIGVIYMMQDPAAGTKVALEFQKDHPNFVVTSGLLEKKALSPDQLKAIAELPTKEVLLAQIVGSLVAPHRRLLGALSGVSRNLVQVINAIKEKKS